MIQTQSKKRKEEEGLHASAISTRYANGARGPDLSPVAIPATPSCGRGALCTFATSPIQSVSGRLKRGGGGLVVGAGARSRDGLGRTPLVLETAMRWTGAMRWTARAAGLCLSLTGCGASVSLVVPDGGADVPVVADVPMLVDRPAANDVPMLVDRPAPMDGAITSDGGPPPGCALPGGGVCPVGGRCPAGDGCNTCTCSPGGLLACTEIGCPRDAGPAPCRSASDCRSGQICDGAPGCGTAWTCRPQSGG